MRAELPDSGSEFPHPSIREFFAVAGSQKEQLLGCAGIHKDRRNDQRTEIVPLPGFIDSDMRIRNHTIEWGGGHHRTSAKAGEKLQNGMK